MDNIRKPVGRRTMLAGAAGLGLATIAGGTLVRAQATPDAGDGSTTTDTDATDGTTREDFAAEAGVRYDDFVTRLAGNLNISDSTQVDTAIRTTLTDLVGARFDAGEISANDADAARTAIAESPAPLAGLLMVGQGGGPGGFGRGRGGPGGWGMPGQPGNDTDDTNDTNPATPDASV